MQAQDERGSGHEVKHAVDAEARHHARADQRTCDRAEPTDEDQPAAHRHDPIGRHAVVRIGDADRIQGRHETTEQYSDRQNHPPGRGQVDQSNGAAGKAEAECRQRQASVEAVREPTHRNLECETAEHGHQHGHADRLARDALVLQPRRNERVKRAADEPAQCAAGDREGCCARKLAQSERRVGGQPGRLGSGRADHDEGHGEEGGDRRERCGGLDLGSADQQLSHRKSNERADHVDREDPPALRWLGLGIEPTLGRDEEPGAAEADDRA
jgi:hypothetical protein